MYAPMLILLGVLVVYSLGVQALAFAEFDLDTDAG
jgi:hypothetical protein